MNAAPLFYVFDPEDRTNGFMHRREDVAEAILAAARIHRDGRVRGPFVIRVHSFELDEISRDVTAEFLPDDAEEFARLDAVEARAWAAHEDAYQRPA